MYNFLEKNRIYIVYLPLVIYWIVIFILTSLPIDIAININVSDKIEHFGAYGVLSFLLFFTLSFQKKIPLFKEFPATFTLVFASLYGMVDELHQLLVPGRNADIKDWIADLTGALLAVLIAKYILNYLKNYDAKKTA